MIACAPTIDRSWRGDIDGAATVSIDTAISMYFKRVIPDVFNLIFVKTPTTGCALRSINTAWRLDISRWLTKTLLSLLALIWCASTVIEGVLSANPNSRE